MRSADPDAKPGLHTPSERGQAWALHVFTTLGVVFGVLALRYVLLGRADLAIILVPPVTCSVRLLCAGCHERTLVRR